MKEIKARYKFGIEVPREVQDALLIDKENGNTLWMDALQKEKDMLFCFDTFKVLDKGEKAPMGYKRIPVF